MQSDGSSTKLQHIDFNSPLSAAICGGAALSPSSSLAGSQGQDATAPHANALFKHLAGGGAVIALTADR